MLSISSEDSDCEKSLDPEGVIISSINQISHRIFAEYKESRGFKFIHQWAPTGFSERGGSSDKPGRSGSSSNQPIPREASQSNGLEARRSGKRSHPNDEEEDEDWDDGGFRRPARPTKRPTRSSNRPRGRILACPFWKLDSQAHGTCFRTKCSRIGDVKFHLSRKHRQPAPEYCQRCWTPFQNEAHKNAHLRDETGQACSYNPSARPVGIDNTMAAALHKKSNPKKSTEDQWFAIWDIVFPGQPKPSSPYIDDSLAEEASQLQEHIVNQWPSILATELEGAWGLAGSNDTDRIGLEHLIRVTLSRLSDEFSAERAQIRAVSAATSHQSPEGQTSPSVRADSAIGMSSYQSNGHSSAGSSNEASRSFLEPTAVPQLETHSREQVRSSMMQNRREIFILPRIQNSLNVDNDQQQAPIPPPTTSSRSTLPDLPNMQMTELCGGGISYGSELTIDDLFAQPIEDPVSQSFLENGELYADASLEGMEALSEFGWQIFES